MYTRLIAATVRPPVWGRIGRASPRREFVDAIGRMVADAADQVGEIGLRIDAVQLTGLSRPPNYAALARFCQRFSWFSR